MLENRMKSQLLSNKPAFGVSIMVPSPQLVEMVAKLGFDWVLIDCEHGTINPETVETLAMAAQANGITPIARPRTRNPADIQQVIANGVQWLAPAPASPYREKAANAPVSLSPIAGDHEVDESIH